MKCNGTMLGQESPKTKTEQLDTQQYSSPAMKRGPLERCAAYIYVHIILVWQGGQIQSMELWAHQCISNRSVRQLRSLRPHPQLRSLRLHPQLRSLRPLAPLRSLRPPQQLRSFRPPLPLYVFHMAPRRKQMKGGAGALFHVPRGHARQSWRKPFIV